MQAIPILGGILLALAQPAPGPAPLYQAAVLLPEAEVRCLPGTGPLIYATNRLRQNQLVQVVKERPDGWLEILPPPGSFSWINKRQVTNFTNHPDNWVVNSDRSSKVPVFVGSDINPQSRGTVVGVQLPAGTQVPRAAGRSEVSDHEGTWLPIEAPLGELRYIRAEAVDYKTRTPVTARLPAPALPAPAPANRYTVGSSPIGFPPAGAPGSPPVTEADRLWQRAQQAESAGNYNEAIQLYSQLASQPAGTSHELAMQGLNRAYWLRQSQRNSSMPTIPPVQPLQVPVLPTSETRYGSQPPVSQPLTAAVRPSPQAGTETASSFTPHATAYPGAQQVQPASASTAPWQPVTPEGYRSSGPGRLRPAGRMVDGKRSYVLESSQNYPLLYCTPNRGVDLEPFLNQNVQLIGPAIYRGDLYANYMIVVRVQPLP